jgi:DNA invertase Pin-like site-specific DNA recombinase
MSQKDGILANVTLHCASYPNVTDLPMSRVGYARVSATDRDLDIQIARLKAVGCDIVRHETGSGASRAARTELETIMQFLRNGDELVVLRLDRLGRSTRDVLNLVHELDERGASLRVLEPEVTTSGDMGRMVITILGMVADMELKFIKDRQRAGIEAAKAEGVYRGRRKNVDDEEIRRRIAAGASKADVARQLKVSRMTVYRALNAIVPTATEEPPNKPPSATVALHLIVENFSKHGRGRKPARERIEAMLERDFAMVKTGNCDYRLTVTFDSDPDGASLDDEIDHLYTAMNNIVESYRCSIEADIREIGGEERSW